MAEAGGRGTAALAVRVARVPGGRRALARDLSRLAAWVATRHARDVELSFAVVDDAEMAALHERYAGEPGPTDVLSFPLVDEPVLVGEVAFDSTGKPRLICSPAISIPILQIRNLGVTFVSPHQLWSLTR